MDGAYAKLQKEKSVDSANDKAMIGRYDETNKKLIWGKKQDSADLSQSKKDIGILKTTIDKLIADHEREPAPIPFDSTSSIVSNNSIRNCANCFVALKDGERKVGKLMNDFAELNHKNDQLISLKDKHIDSLGIALAAKEHFYNSLQNLYAKAAKPRANLYFGAGYTFSPSYESVGLWAVLKDRRNRIYGLGGGVNNMNSWYVEAKAGLKVF